MNSIVKQQQPPSSRVLFNGEQNEGKTQQSMKNDIPIVQNQLPSRDNFPKGLRGGGACYDCLACLCCCCVLDDIACLECCREC